MEGLITIIMLAAFIFNTVIKAEGKNEKRRAKQSVSDQRQSADRTVQKTTQKQRDAYYYSQQQSTKERLQKKYGRQGDILLRAKENVQETEEDSIRQEIHAEVCREYCESSQTTSDVEVHKRQSMNCDTGEESDIIKKVNDLIVTGYSGDMQFERDFIAEGIDMLNRFSL